MLAKILDSEQEALLEREREALRSAQVLLASCGARPEDLEALERSIHQLDRLFLLVVVGEFNSGKSTLILLRPASPCTTPVPSFGWSMRSPAVYESWML